MYKSSKKKKTTHHACQWQQNSNIQRIQISKLKLRWCATGESLAIYPFIAYKFCILYSSCALPPIFFALSFSLPLTLSLSLQKQYTVIIKVDYLKMLNIVGTVKRWQWWLWHESVWQLYHMDEIKWKCKFYDLHSVFLRYGNHIQASISIAKSAELHSNAFAFMYLCVLYICAGAMTKVK